MLFAFYFDLDRIRTDQKAELVMVTSKTGQKAEVG